MTFWLIFAVAVLAVCVIIMFVFIDRKIALERKDKEQKEIKRIQGLKIVEALERSGYKIYGGLIARVDPDAKRLSLGGKDMSYSFDVDQVGTDGDWKVFVYNGQGERRVMPLETFEMHLLEVRDKYQTLREEVGFEHPVQKPATATGGAGHSGGGTGG